MAQSFELGKEYPPEGEESQIQQILTISHRAMEKKSEEIFLRNLRWESLPKRKPIRSGFVFLMDVEGTMAFDDPDHPKEQDFILMNHPAFFIRDIQGYIDFFPIAKAIKDKEITFNPNGTPKHVPENLQKQFQAVAYAFPLLGTIRAKKTSSPLEITYWSATPYKQGDQAMKYSAVPQIVGEKFDPETATDPENYLREAMTKHLASKDAYFDFKIQLQTDASTMPVEDPTEKWDENESPYVKVATIKIPQQDFNTEERLKLDEKQSFSPWHSLEVHRPLGGVNRARKIYIELAKIRNQESKS